MELANTQAIIDLDAIENNFRRICQRAGSPVMAVVKADAYGHGAVPVAKVLESMCAFFGVSSPAEALQLRSAGLAKPILILGHAQPDCFPALIGQDIRPTIFTLADAQALSRAAQALNKPAKCHLAVDTGMSRIGFQVCPADADICAQIARLPGVEVEGIFSHFATADEADLTRTQAQAARFDSFCRMLEERGLHIPIRHLDNSAGIMTFGSHGNMVRAGIVIYGLYPSGQVDQSRLSLTPAMSWHTRVTQVKLLEPGRQVSYGGTWTAERPTLVATIPAGYADGYRRCLGNRFYVLIHGQKAPLVGRVCMDQMMADVTHIPGVQPGDPVVLMGTDGAQTISAEDIAAAAGSFNYEQVCDLSHRVTRIYLRHGKEAGRTNYLL